MNWFWRVPTVDASGVRRALIALGALALLLRAFSLDTQSAPSVEFGSTHLDGVEARPVGAPMDFGSLRGERLAQPVVGMTATPSGEGYWLVARDGGIFSFGNATFFGSTGAVRLNQPIVGMAATPSSGGYWFVAADGGVFSFGDAQFFGSTGAVRLQRPIVGMAATPSGRGYWLVASDGGIFTFGDALYAGSASGATAGSAVVAMAATPTGKGYWVAGADGRVFAFGDAVAHEPRQPAGSAPTVGIGVTPDGSGYWTVDASGAVRAFGSAPQLPSSNAPGTTIVGIAAAANSYWVATSGGDVLMPVQAATVAATAAPVAPVGAYEFLAHDPSGRPLRYDPCQPVRYAINPAGAPAGAVDEVREMFRRAGNATAIDFVDAGDTTETHLRYGTTARAAYQPDRYGVGRWAPILVSWASDAEEPRLAGPVVGYGGSTSYWLNTTDPAYITGEIVFDRDLGGLQSGFGPGRTRGNVVAHELAHVLGLHHVQDQSQLMYPSLSTTSPDGFSSGDLAGLAALGRQAGCLTIAEPR